MTRVFGLCALVFLPLAVLTFFAVPIAYDTVHVPDTLFLADLGWRRMQGLEPVLDFGHFYGGVVAQYMATAFALFGTSLKSVDHAFGLMALSVLGLAGALCWTRVPRRTALALCMVLVACLLARVPLETLTAIQRPMASHAFIYNRLAIAVAVLLVLFALLPARDRRIEAGAALLAGALCYGLVLIKPTFVVFAPFFLLALTVQGRWLALGLGLVGLIAAGLALDFGGTRAIGAFSYGVAAASGNTSVSGMVLKCFAVFLVHPLALMLVLLLLLGLLTRPGASRIGTLLAVLCLGAGFAGMTATMGWLGDVGQQTLPFYAALGLAFTERLRRQTPAAPALGAVFTMATLALVLAFSLPQLAQTTLSGAAAALRQPLIQTTGTPLDHYLAWSDELIAPDGGPITDTTPWADQVAATITHLEAGLRPTAGTDYTHLIDAARLLRTVPDTARQGIVADVNGLAYVMQSPPVPGFPVWVNVTAPELGPDRTLPAQTSLVMIRRVAPPAISQRLQQMARPAFRPCLQSVLWTLWVRVDAPRDFCTLETENGDGA